MLAAFHKSLVVILATLQLFAPLVHAHAGKNSFNQGLHIPGLELYASIHDAPVFQDVNHDCNPEGLLVVVDAGIKNPLDMFVESVGHSFALLPSGQLRLPALPENDNNFSPRSQSISFLRLHSSHPPRAPPTQ